MKSEIFLQYRSLCRTDPLWIEQALYGGYTHISLADGVWVSRIYEYAIMSLVNKLGTSLQQEAKEILSRPGVMFNPTSLQQSNFSKLMILCNRVKHIGIVGYSHAAEEFLNNFFHTTVYSDAVYRVPKSVLMSTEEICKLSDHMLVLIPNHAVTLKEHIANWGNVIVYTPSMFYEDDSMLQLGGENGTSATELPK